MRLNRKWQKDIHLKKKVVLDDGEGGYSEDYSNESFEIRANIQPLSSRIQAEVYGEKINDMRNMLYSGDIEINIGDGLCIDTDGANKPDFKVISKKCYTNHITFELEII